VSPNPQTGVCSERQDERRREEGFYWGELGQNLPEIGEWWLVMPSWTSRGGVFDEMDLAGVLIVWEGLQRILGPTGQNIFLSTIRRSLFSAPH
jgi:hypothetical protein